MFPYNYYPIFSLFDKLTKSVNSTICLQFFTPPPLAFFYQDFVSTTPNETTVVKLTNKFHSAQSTGYYLSAMTNF